MSYICNFHHNFSSSTGLIYQRCRINGVLFYSKLYTRSKKRNSFTVTYYNGAVLYGQIEYFLCIDVEKSCFVYAYITEFQKDCDNKAHFNLQHNALDYGVARIVPVSVSGQKILVEVNSLLCKCVYVNVASQNYVCIPPNTLSID